MRKVRMKILFRVACLFKIAYTHLPNRGSDALTHKYPLNTSSVADFSVIGALTNRITVSI